MKNKLSLLTLLLVSFIFPSIAAAEEMSYSVQANIPANQIDKSKTYFDLLVEPGQNQTLSLTVSNSGEETIEVLVEPHNASTNNSGVITYKETEKELDPSLTYPFSELVSESQTVTLAPGEKKELTFQVKMPEEKFDGIILGAFRVTNLTASKPEEKTDNVQLKYKYAYVVGVQLRQNQHPVPANLNLTGAEAGLRNYHTTIYANIQNDQATIINDLTIKAEVSKKGSDELLYETTKEKMSVAPNTNFDFPIDLNNQSLKAGTYLVKVTMTSQDQTWQEETELVIKNNDAKELNQSAVELETTNFDWKLVVILILALVVISGLLYLVISQRKKS